jgi:hypothetical protein
MFTFAPQTTTLKACAKLSMRSCRLALPLAAALLAGTSLASANSITFDGVNYGESVTVSGTGGVVSGLNISADAGQFQLYDNTAGKSLVAWCLDLVDLVAGTTNYTVGPLLAGGPIDSVSAITQPQINELGWLMSYGNAHITTPDESAATQLAIWWVEYGKGNLTFTNNDPAITLAGTLYTDALGFATILGDVTQYVPDSGQSLGNGGTTGGGGTVPSTPLPAALPLFATGLGALGLLGWRRKRKNAAA